MLDLDYLYFCQPNYYKLVLSLQAVKLPSLLYKTSKDITGTLPSKLYCAALTQRNPIESFAVVADL